MALCNSLYIGCADAIKTFGQDSLSAAVGTGPYMLCDISESRATLKANPYYSFSPKAPAVETVNVLFDPFSADDVVNGLISGKLDASFPLHRSTIDAFESAGWDGSVNIIYNTPQTIWFNVQTVDAFKNRELRAAVSKLIDLDEINRELYDGLGKVQYGLWPESSELYVQTNDASLTQEEALAVLEKAGIDPLDITLPYISLFSDTEILCRQLENAGFTTEKIDLPQHMITGTSASKGAFISHTYPEQISPVNSIDSILNAPILPCCFQQLYDAELYGKIQDEFEKLKQAASRDEMVDRAKTITRYLQDDCALIGGISTPSVFPVSARLAGCEYSPLAGNIRLYNITLR